MVDLYTRDEYQIDILQLLMNEAGIAYSMHETMEDEFLIVDGSRYDYNEAIEWVKNFD